MRTFKVEFCQKYTGIADWFEDEKTVAASDAAQAIAKVKAKMLSDEFTDEETGKVHKCTGFDPTGVTLLSETDI